MTGSAGQLDVPKGDEPAGRLRASLRRATTGARRWQEKILARATSEDRVFAWAAVVLAVLIAFGLRAFRLGVSWDLGQDELDYLQMSQGVLRTMWVVGWDGSPFYIHPPLFFFLEAAYMKLFGISNRQDLIQQIQAVR
jgi:hypothetical protein